MNLWQARDGYCIDSIKQINKFLSCTLSYTVFIIWCFHYGPEPAINKNQQMASGSVTLKNTSPQ